MSELYNISNAFKELDLLTEDTFKADDTGIDKLRDFMDGDQVDEITIIDPEAETFDDVKESYIGKVILNCGVCQSKFYKDKEDIVIDEETQLVNVGEECPYCTSADGFEIVGQVAEYCPDCHEDEDHDDMSEDQLDLDESADIFKASKIRSNYYDWDQFMTEILVKLENKYDIDSAPSSQAGIGRDFYFANIDDRDYSADIDLDDESNLVYNAVKSIRDRDAAIDAGVEVLKKWWDENKLEECLKESVGSNLAKYQNWVDYDMKKYGKISGKTKRDLDKANLTIVKDKYGAYQVISKELDGKALEESKDLTKFDGTIAKLLADNMSKLSNVTSVSELKSKIVDLLDSSDIKDKKAVADFKARMDKIKNTVSLLSTIATYITGMKSQPEDSKKVVKESVESVEVKTDTDTVCIDTDGDGTKVEVKPRDDFETEAEMITPVDDEVKDEIEAEQVSDEEVSDEEVGDEDNFEDIDFDEFDEESFDELGEQYLKKVYENVKSYKTSSGSMKDDKLKLEGVITFNSGKQAKTTFLFEGASILKNGTLKLIGENKNFSDKKNAFGLRGKVNGKKLMIESFNYNYLGKDAATGQSKKLYGTIRKAK